MIAIVGGGISGLTVAHGLREREAPHVLFEAAPEPGGVMRTAWEEGEPLDLGPQRTRLTAGVARLVGAVGLREELLTAPPDLPLWIYRGGRLRRVPLGLGEAVSTDALGWPAKLRVLLEPFTRGLDSDETVARFFTRKFGREAYENLIGPFYGGLYASDPARMYARHGLRITLDHFGVRGSLLLAFLRRGGRAREAIDTITFREGLQTLPLALARADRENVRLGTTVRALRRSGKGSWILEVEGREGDDALEADAVVLSCPSEVAARLLEPVDPEASGRIARLHVNRLAVVHLRSAYSERGYGYQVAFGEALETRGCTWNASIFGRTGIFTCYLGGMRRPDLVDWPEERIADVACSEFRTVTGSEAGVLKVSRTRIPAWDESWDALMDLRLPPGIHLCSNWSSRPGIPGRVTQADRLVESLLDGGKPRPMS
jgi:oxygen-dependent protoporphyrinogen oxidase